MAPCCLQDKLQTPWPGVQGLPQSRTRSPTTLAITFLYLSQTGEVRPGPKVAEICLMNGGVSPPNQLLCFGGWDGHCDETQLLGHREYVTDPPPGFFLMFCSTMIVSIPKKRVVLLEPPSCLMSWFHTPSMQFFGGPLLIIGTSFLHSTQSKRGKRQCVMKPLGSALAGMQKHFITDYFWRVFTASRKGAMKFYLNRRKLNYLSHAHFYQVAGDDKSIRANMRSILLKR